MAKIIELIYTQVERGNGKDIPVRIVEQYWTKDGILLFEKDPLVGMKENVYKSDKENEERFMEICY